MGFIKSMQGVFSGKPDPAKTTELIREQLRGVIDPDLHQDIVTLGFVKKIELKGAKAYVVVELTTPACPVKEKLRAEVEEKVKAIDGIEDVHVEMTAVTRGGPKAVSDQAQEALGRVKNIIAVASGKGGVGKSTTAVNLAFALARAGSKVGILDADVYGPSIPQMTKVENPTEMVGNLVKPPVVDGVKVISVGIFQQGNQAAMLRGPMAAQIIRQFLTQIAWEELDYLVIDYPPGTGDIQLTLSQIAPITGAVLVTTPQEVALLDVRKALNLFNTMKVPVLGVVETMSYFVCDGCDKKHYIFREGGGDKLANEHGVPVLGRIPIDPRVASTGDEGNPVVTSTPDSIAAKAYEEAAGKIAAQISILNAQQQGALNYFAVDWK